VVGREAGRGDAALRLRIVPLPSIGMRHTDPDIRRLLVEVPPDHPIPLKDLEWALAGRELADVNGEFTGVVLTPTTDSAMLKRYGVDLASSPSAARVWRTVTPAALPDMVGRDGRARAEAEARAAGSIAQALRHAGVTTPVTDVRIQREPFDLRGERSDRFESDRFDVHDLRHVELTFAQPIAGPLVIGNGRWLGLGVMRTVSRDAGPAGLGMAGLHVFGLEAGPMLRPSDAEAITRALRRAVMARAQAVAGPRLRRGDSLPSFFTGPVEGAAPDRATARKADGLHEHLFYGLDPGGGRRPPRLLIVAPHLADLNGEVLRSTRSYLKWLGEAVNGLEDLRAGRLGRFDLKSSEVETNDPVCGPGMDWTSLTPYQPTRHPHLGQVVEEAVVADVLQEARRRNLPRPAVEVVSVDIGSRGGIRANLRLRFAVAVPGPIMLGKNSHFGAGLFGHGRIQKADIINLAEL
jgi:CRISPR-associated protein Csb2